jgi:hypothetical protein
VKIKKGKNGDLVHEDDARLKRGHLAHVAGQVVAVVKEGVARVHHLEKKSIRLKIN